jgi:hypothetical protein
MEVVGSKKRKQIVKNKASKVQNGGGLRAKEGNEEDE